MKTKLFFKLLLTNNIKNNLFYRSLNIWIFLISTFDKNIFNNCINNSFNYDIFSKKIKIRKNIIFYYCSPK